MSTQGEYLKGIADAIREKDGTAEPIQAKMFADRIRAISGGGKPGEPLDPKAVYKATRPADWLPMPTPNDDEIYLLFHIPDGLTAKICFVVDCTGSYKVEHGTVENGEYVSRKVAQTVESGTNYEEELDSADYGEEQYGPSTSDGFRQVMIKVSGDTITKLRNAVGSDKAGTVQHFAMWNVVEIRCKLPSATEVKCYAEYDGDTSHTNTSAALSALFYFTMDGTNSLTSTEWMFSGCRRLVCVPELDMSGAGSAERMFSSCYSLTAIPPLDTQACSNMQSMFSSCYSLTAIPQLNTQACSNMSYMFNSCYSLTAKTDLDISAVTANNKLQYTFQNCYNLEKVTIKSMEEWTTDKQQDLYFENLSLSEDALKELFTSLPNVNSKTIHIKDNPGTDAVMASDADKQIATAKGWTVSNT